MGDRDRVGRRQLSFDKRAGLGDALAAVRDGHRVAFGGMTLYRRPVAAALALAAAGRTGLELVSLTGGLETDLLIGAGCYLFVRGTGSSEAPPKGGRGRRAAGQGSHEAEGRAGR